jgi:predicted RNA-binding Zn-ribbon protein involved in translation (DUF1610 family)
MGYIGQHLVSVVTGYPGGKSGARGRDLILPDDSFAEIKTCYRVDQLGRCNSCGAVIASIELTCPLCESKDIRRNDDSKWLIGIRNDTEFEEILDPKYYYLALFDFVDVNQPDTIRASIWRVDPNAPGFAYCMIDYYLNIRTKSISKAPFNLWPFQLKFEIMRPELIYRSYIKPDDTIETEIFPGRDKSRLGNIKQLTEYSQSLNLTTNKILDLARYLSVEVDSETRKLRLLSMIQSSIERRGINERNIADIMAFSLYHSDIKNLGIPAKLKQRLDQIDEQVQTLLSTI